MRDNLSGPWKFPAPDSVVGPEVGIVVGPEVGIVVGPEVGTEE
jgi:hypothetical protein